MADLKTIVDRMIAAGEKEEAIGGVIREFNRTNPPKPPKPIAPPAQEVIGEPDNFAEGFSKSLFSGEAAKAGWEGAKGFAKGAIADIPETLAGGIEGIGIGLKSLYDDPIAHVKAAPQAFRELGHDIAETTRHAGSDSEAFGRMVGQITGQPLVTEAAMMGSLPGRLGRPIGRLAGKAVDNTVGTQNVASGLSRVGKVLEKKLPSHGVSVNPTVIGLRTVRSGVSKLGKGMQGVAENLRLNNSGVESPNQFATRGGGTNRASHFTSEPPTDIDPMFRSEPAPPEGVRLVKDKALTPEEQMAAAVQEVRDSFARQGEPGVEMPPPPYSHGAGAPPEQPRITVKAPKTPKSKAPKKTKAPKEEFEPSTDPKPTVDTTTGEITEPSSISPETETAFRQIFEGLDEKPSVPKLKRVGGKWQIVKDLFKSGNDAGSAEMPSWAERVAAKMQKSNSSSSNRAMFDLANKTARNSKLPKEIEQFQRSMPHEFSPDLVQHSDNIFEGASPRFEARQSFDDIQKRMYELTDKGTNGTLTDAELAEAQKLNKVWRNHPEFGASKSAPEAPKKSSFMDKVNAFVRDESGELDTDGLPQLVKRDGNRTKAVGPKGHSFKVTAPDGKHLGDITIRPEEVDEVRKMPGLEDLTAEQITQSMHDAQLSDILEQHGYSDDDMPRMKVEKSDNRKKTTPVTELAEGKPTFSTNKVEKVEFDPDAAFAKGGDTRPIAEEAARLDKTTGGDLKFKPLLPKSLQYALEEGETFKNRLSNLLEASKDLDEPSLAAARKRIEEADAFAASVGQAKDVVSDLPLLNLKKLKPGDFKTPLNNRLRGMIGGGERKPEIWTSPKPKRRGES